MVFSNCGHSHENEDKSLTDAAQHLHEILYGGVGLLRNILLDIFIHAHSTSYDATGGENHLSFSFGTLFLHTLILNN